MKASDLVIDSNSSFLFKAPWGFSKTCAAASFAVGGDIFMAYFDKKKPLELQHYFYKIVKRPELLKRIEFEVYGAHNAGEYLEKMMALAKDCRYFAVITDSVTNLTSAAVNWSLAYRDNKKNKDKALKVIPEFDEYKVETSIVTQALDLSRTFPCHVIWTAHPLAGIKVEGSGPSMRITKTNPIVSYGSKVGSIVPGQFSEIYHFAKEESWDSNLGKSTTKYIVNTEAVGDDFAKSNIGLKNPFDITDKLFYNVWKEEVTKLKEEMKDALNEYNEAQDTSINPFGKIEEPKPTERKWNSEKGKWE